MMISHNFLPPSLSKVILNPIVKDKTGNISDKDNYRPIALATVSFKIMERVILNRCKLKLATGDHQFGFKGTNPALKKPSNIPEIYAKMFGRFH